MIVVVSTGLNAPTKQLCINSVRSQSAPHHHEYIESDPDVCALENFVAVARDSGPSDILVSLDGDDWFAHDGVVRSIADVYQDPDVWMTYGSFRYADGRPGFASEYKTDDFRSQQWRATHLKTFRASLFGRLTADDLQRDGQYRDLCWDMTVMFPMLEMSGLEHSRFLPEVHYVYNYASSWEHSASPAERDRERRMNSELRAMPRRERLSCL